VARFLEHPSRASRWSGQEFEVLPAAASEDATVWFSVPTAPSAANAEPTWEGLLAKRLTSDRVEIAAVPVFLYDLNLGDEPAVMESGEGALVATGVVRDAGRFTYRVLFPDGTACDPDERWRDLHLALAPFGCWLDVYTPRLIAVSAEAHVAHEVADYFAAEVASGRLQYETGRSASPGG